MATDEPHPDTTVHEHDPHSGDYDLSTEHGAPPTATPSDSPPASDVEGDGAGDIEGTSADVLTSVPQEGAEDEARQGGAEDEVTAPPATHEEEGTAAPQVAVDEDVATGPAEGVGSEPDKEAVPAPTEEHLPVATEKDSAEESKTVTDEDPPVDGGEAAAQPVPEPALEPVATEEEELRGQLADLQVCFAFVFFLYSTAVVMLFSENIPHLPIKQRRTRSARCFRRACPATSSSPRLRPPRLRRRRRQSLRSRSRSRRSRSRPATSGALSLTTTRPLLVRQSLQSHALSATLTHKQHSPEPDEGRRCNTEPGMGREAVQGSGRITPTHTHRTAPPHQFQLPPHTASDSRSLRVLSSSLGSQASI